MMRTDEDAEDLRRRLRAAVKMRGIEDVAASIPAQRSTVWRFLARRTEHPSMAVREGMERVLDDLELRMERSSGSR